MKNIKMKVLNCEKELSKINPEDIVCIPKVNTFGIVLYSGEYKGKKIIVLSQFHKGDMNKKVYHLDKGHITEFDDRNFSDTSEMWRYRAPFKKHFGKDVFDLRKKLTLIEKIEDFEELIFESPIQYQGEIGIYIGKQSYIAFWDCPKGIFFNKQRNNYSPIGKIFLEEEGTLRSHKVDISPQLNKKEIKKYIKMYKEFVK